MLISLEKKYQQKFKQFNLYGKLKKQNLILILIKFSLNFGLKKQIYIYRGRTSFTPFVFIIENPSFLLRDFPYRN